MNDDDRWVYLDGKPPADVQQFLLALLELPPPTPEEQEVFDDNLFEELEAVAAHESEERRARQAEAGAVSVAAGAPAPITEGPQTVAAGGVTVRSPIVAARDEAPAEAAPSAPAPPAMVQDPAPPALPTYVPAPAHLAITGPAMELPAGKRESWPGLPFRPLAAGEVPALLTTADTVQLPVFGLVSGLTAPGYDTPIAEPQKVHPFPASQAAEPVVEPPALTVEQYASLQVELAMQPGKKAETLARYHVAGEDGLAALDAKWRPYLGGTPEERAGFDQAYGKYLAWWWGRPR